MTEAERRLDLLVRRFVADYLPSFLALLCDQGVDPEDQKRRADRLVRSLRTAEIHSNLRREGRRIIVDIDDDIDPPKVVFNEQFVEDVDASEALGLLEEPIERLLDLTSFRVNLLLQIDDDDSQKTLVNRARRNGDAELARIADIPSVVDLRIRVFLDRLRRIAGAYATEPTLDVDLGGAVETVVENDVAGWPSWEEVGDAAFVRDILEQLEEAYAGATAHPTPGTTGAICWESLELSPRSALRRAAELLRAERNESLDVGSTLRNLREVLRGTGGEIPESAAEWREFRELAEQWRRLFRSEQRMLSWSPVRRETPDLSVFEPPLESLGLDEPESLPWESPLLCWSVRERQALSDLLDGTRSTIASERDADGAFEVHIETFSELRALHEADERSEFALRPAPDPDRQDGEAGERLVRAIRACYGRLFKNFCRLDPSEQRAMLQRLRSSYDGYFGDVQEVWERRFQSWEAFEPPRALRRLSREIEHVLGPGTLLAPFEAPLDGELVQVPSFVFVAPFSAEASVTNVRVPLVALRASFENAPTRIRAVEVPEENGGRCRWLGDEELSSRDLTEMPTESVLDTIRGGAVRLQIERS